MIGDQKVLKSKLVEIVTNKLKEEGKI